LTLTVYANILNKSTILINNVHFVHLSSYIQKTFSKIRSWKNQPLTCFSPANMLKFPSIINKRKEYMAGKSYFYGLGRRKEATASARLLQGKGSITINGKPALEYLSGNRALEAKLTDPLALVSKQKDFDITIVVKGGGISGQVGAAQLAISKALASINDDFKGTLKKAGFLRRDPRMVERKKYGLKGARKAEQFSKR
jgi:small subunit ribosomal protein S9